MDKFLSLLGLMRRAGKLEIGFDAVKETLLKGKSKLIITTSDISPKTEKEIRFFAEKSEESVKIISVSYDSQNMKDAIGRNVKIIALTDEGFARSATQLLEKTN